MPNYIKNRIAIIGTPEQIQEVFSKHNTHVEAQLYRAYDDKIICKSKNGGVGWLDTLTGEFETRADGKRIGMPKDFEIELTKAFDMFPDFNKIKPQPENIFTGNLGDKERELCKKEGRPNWYDWNIQNWGTKWNISECKKENYNTFTFVTAWNGVTPLMKELSKINPEIEFHYEYADEDTGCNCAAYKFKDGEAIEVFEPENSSKEAYELAFKLRPHYKENYVLVNDNYEYKDEE